MLEYLEELMEAGFVQKYREWNLSNPSKEELFRYRIWDNYSRFYLKFIALSKNQRTYSKGATSWMAFNYGLQFESLVITHHIELCQALLKPWHLLPNILVKSNSLAEVISEAKEKIRRLSLSSGISIRPLLVHVNGVTDELLATEYFADIVNFADLL